MTSTANPEYIRLVSVSYKRCPSSYSVRSTLSGTNFTIDRNRPKTAAEVCNSAREEANRIVERERTEMLDELMFFYGRNVSNSFNFSKSGARRHATHSYYGSPWDTTNSASLQMHRAHGRSPRRRMFPQISIQPVTLTKQSV